MLLFANPPEIWMKFEPSEHWVWTRVGSIKFPLFLVGVVEIFPIYYLGFENRHTKFHQCALHIGSIVRLLRYAYRLKGNCKSPTDDFDLFPTEENY